MRPWRSSREATRRFLLARCIAAALALLASNAPAQTPSPLAEWQYSAGHVLEPYFTDETPQWRRLVGAAVQVIPRYEGSDEFRYQPGLMLDLRYRDLAFASTAEGIGVNLLRGKGYRAGIAATYDLGRPDDRGARLHGLGDIDPAAEAKAFAEYVVKFPLVVRADVRRVFRSGGGWIGDVSAYMPVAGDKKFFLMTGPSLTFADARHQQASFGVTPSQSLRSGLSVYEPGAGLRSASYGVGATWFLGSRWLIDLTGAAQWLLGDARDSPLVERTQQYVLSGTVAYTW